MNSQTDTPRTDAVLARDWKRTSYTKAGELESLAKSLERDNAALLAAQRVLQTAQQLRPILLAQYGVVPECVLDFCNRARAALAKGET